MKAVDYMQRLNAQLSHLYAFARQINELDFAASLGGEFRGMQDAGWSTPITANKVFEEISVLVQKSTPLTEAEFRVVLMLYCQLSEAGGVYEGLKNIMGVVSLKPYNLWPFQSLVKVRPARSRVIGPNANATFINLAKTAREIGMIELSRLFETAFRDDIRNGIVHADYIIWSDGLRLRHRNGGNVYAIAFEELGDIVTRALGFFDLLRDYNGASVRSFEQPKTIVGRFSANPPMPWTVKYDPNGGGFSISGSSPGMVSSPDYERQVEINNRLGGKVLATYSVGDTDAAKAIDAHILAEGFEPHAIVMAADAFEQLKRDVDRLGLWDKRSAEVRAGEVLLASPWGFLWLSQPADFNAVLEKPLLEIEVDHHEKPVSV